MQPASLKAVVLQSMTIGKVRPQHGTGLVLMQLDAQSRGAWMQSHKTNALLICSAASALLVLDASVLQANLM